MATWRDWQRTIEARERALILITTPVIERELRQQSRRSAGVWMRVMAAALAGLTAVAILGSTTGGLVNGSLPGLAVFNTLSVVALVFCLFEGVRQTSDCLSREKREGTLGLLLLTDLRGLDVLLGKLAATSLGSFYVLMAIFPALATALPYGGVTGGEFWRTQLVLLNTLFLGLAVGMWSSAREREAGRSFITGLSLAGALLIFPLLFEIFLRRGPLPSLSPAVALQLAGDRFYAGAPLRFWLTILALQGFSWALLMLGGRRLAQAWQDEERPATVQSLLEQAAPKPDSSRWAPDGEPVWNEDFATYWNTRSPVERPDPSWIDDGPARWLAAWIPQHRFLAALSIYLLALGIFADTLLGIFLGRAIAGTLLMAVTWLTALLPWLLLAYVASRPLADARRSGALELLLATPLPATEIVESHWQSLWLQLRGPVKVCSIIMAVVSLFWLAAIVTDGRPNDSSVAFAMALLHGASRVIAALAICRLGFYFSLKMRSLFAAMGLTLLWAVILPWVFQAVLAVAIIFFGPGFSPHYWAIHFASAGAVVVYLVLAAGWAKKKLPSEFRRLAAETEN